MNGYAGQLLFVDLSEGTCEFRPLDEKIAHDFIGGYGIGAKILYDEMPANTDPFAPESMIGFITGTLNGSSGLMGGRYTVVSKSPVYNGWNDANSGGSFGPYMRMAGVDGIFVKGIADHPVYILVDDGEASIHDATHLWGKTIMETEAALQEELDKRICAAIIGPAGERKAYTACVMNNSHRAAGRGGSGAVMGSKNLKAVVCRGKQKLEKADPEGLKALNKATMEWQKGPVKPVVDGFGPFGTGGMYESCVLSGDAAVYNWKGAGVTDLPAEEISWCSAMDMDERYRVKKFACHACPIGCGAVYKVDYGKYQCEDSGRPEYETAGGFGSQMGNTNPDVVNVCNYLINEAGMDVIAVAGTVAWLMECYNDGLFTIDELDGIDLKWGNGDAIIAMTEKMCNGEGIGAFIQNGSRWASRHFDRGAYALGTANGIEIAQHDPRFGPGLGRTYILDPTPGRHVKGGLGVACGNEPPEVKYVYDDKGPQDAAMTCEKEMNNCGGFCDFDGFGLPPDACRQMVNAVTGFDFTPEEYANTGKRIWMLRQAFNIREGLRRKDFYLDDRLCGIPPLEKGPLEGVTPDYQTLGDKFYESMGIEVETGVPLKETLEEIGGLDFVIKDIYGE